MRVEEGKGVEGSNLVAGGMRVIEGFWEIKFNQKKITTDAMSVGSDGLSWR